MNIRPNHFFFVPLCLLGLFVIAACTPSSSNIRNLSTRATGEEIKAHYSGNSIRFSTVSAGGIVNAEAYFAENGVYKYVRLDSPQFQIGTWGVDSGTGGYKLVLKFKGYHVSNNEVHIKNFDREYVVYIDPGGSSTIDFVGDGRFSQPKPTRGFQSRDRLSVLKRKAGI